MRPRDIQEIGASLIRYEHLVLFATVAMDTVVCLDANLGHAVRDGDTAQ